MNNTIIFSSVRFGTPKPVEGQGYVASEEPFSMSCTLEKEHIAVSPDGLHCWVRYLDGHWGFALWDGYRLDSVTVGA